MRSAASRDGGILPHLERRASGKRRAVAILPTDGVGWVGRGRGEAPWRPTPIPPYSHGRDSIQMDVMPGDVLSQSDIDTLFSDMAGTSEGGADETRERHRSVRPYDFRRPSKLSKDQMRTLHMIFEGFARKVVANLSEVLRSVVRTTLVSIEQSVFDDYVRGLPQRTLLNVASADPLTGTIVFEYDFGTAMLIVDRLLGGIGTGTVPNQERTVTDIEEVILQSAAGVFLRSLSEAWAHILPMQAKLQRLEYTPRFLQVAPKSEPVLILRFDLLLLEHQTSLSMCIPCSLFEPVAQQLNAQTLVSPASQQADATDSADSHPRMQRMAIPVVALLGGTSLSLGTVNDLQEGDVIRLDGLATDPLLLTVNRKPTFVVRPGVMRQRVAVQVLGTVRDGDATP